MDFVGQYSQIVIHCDHFHFFYLRAAGTNTFFDWVKEGIVEGRRHSCNYDYQGILFFLEGLDLPSLYVLIFLKQRVMAEELVFLEKERSFGEIEPNKKDGEPFEGVIIWESFFSDERALERLRKSKISPLVLIFYDLCCRFSTFFEIAT